MAQKCRCQDKTSQVLQHQVDVFYILRNNANFRNFGLSKLFLETVFALYFSKPNIQVYTLFTTPPATTSPLLLLPLYSTPYSCQEALDYMGACLSFSSEELNVSVPRRLASIYLYSDFSCTYK